MIINKKTANKRSAVKANSRIARNRRVRANEEVEEIEEVGGVNVAEEASDLLFEAEDVGQLLAEVTGQDVAVTADDDVVTFEIGEDVYTAEAEGSEEILESTRIKSNGRNAVRASRRVARRSRTRR